MPTPVIIDGFEHNVGSGACFGSGKDGIWYYIAGGPTIPTGGRNGRCFQVAAAGAECRGIKQSPSDSYIAVMSLYFKTSSTPSSEVNWIVLYDQDWGGSSAAFKLTSGGLIKVTCGGSSANGPDINDGAWHRLDVRINYNYSGNYRCEWSVDGVDQTTVSGATTAKYFRYVVLGTGSTDTYTMQYDDFVLSLTEADYPIGAHDVLFVEPDADGTHVAGTNVMEDQSGNDIGTVSAYPLLNDMAASPTLDYVRQFATGGSNYAEVTFPDYGGSDVICGVEGYAALFSAGTTANNGTTRIVDSGGSTLTDIYSGDMSETAAHYRRAIISAPGGSWSTSGFNGLKARVGFSTNVASVPYWAALMLQYAVVPAGGGAADVFDPFGMMGFYGV